MKTNSRFLGILVATSLLVPNASGGPYAIVSKTVSVVSMGGPYILLGTFGQPSPVILRGGPYSLSEAFFGVVVAIQQPGAPLLKVTRVNQAVVISWPAPSLGFELETKDSLDPEVPWNPVGLPAVIADGENTVTIPLTAQPQFFRLHSP
jgi:hypothetical protein